MTQGNAENILWFGMVHIRPKPEYKEAFKDRGGYNNVVGLAPSEEAFIARVQHYFETTIFDEGGEDVVFDVKRIEDIESYDDIHAAALSDELVALAAALSEEHPIQGSDTIDSYYLEEIR